MIGTIFGRRRDTRWTSCTHDWTRSRGWFCYISYIIFRRFSSRRCRCCLMGSFRFLLPLRTFGRVSLQFDELRFYVYIIPEDRSNRIRGRAGGIADSVELYHRQAAVVFALTWDSPCTPIREFSRRLFVPPQQDDGDRKNLIRITSDRSAHYNNYNTLSE